MLAFGWSVNWQLSRGMLHSHSVTPSMDICAINILLFTSIFLHNHHYIFLWNEPCIFFAFSIFQNEIYTVLRSLKQASERVTKHKAQSTNKNHFIELRIYWVMDEKPIHFLFSSNNTRDCISSAKKGLTLYKGQRCWFSLRWRTLEQNNNQFNVVVAME